jgi:hypothetical protein
MANDTADTGTGGYNKTLTSGQSFTYTGANGPVTVSYAGATEAESTGICSSHTEGHDTNTYACEGHAGAGSGGITTFTAIGAGDWIKAVHVDELRTAIIDEIDRRNSWNAANTGAPYYATVLSNAVAAAGDPSPGSVIDNANLSAIHDAVSTVDSGSTTIPPDLQSVVITPISALGDRIRSLEADCICNADCACNSVCTCNTDCRCNYSDIRLKTEIEELDKGLEFISSLDTYKFKYKENDLGIDSLYTHYGLMAQEIPDTNIVHTEASSGYKKVNYIELIPVLINAIKELSEKIDGK